MSKAIHCSIIPNSENDGKTIGEMVKYTIVSLSAATGMG